jgi:hypothetical protein
MNVLDENDGEYALFLREMLADEAAKRGGTSTEPKSISALLSGETRIDLTTVRKMVRHRNEMVHLLTQFLALHPEDTDLTRRARRFVGHSK